MTTLTGTSTLALENPTWLRDFSHHSYNRGKHHLQYRLHEPEALDDSQETSYPLVLWLHGILGRGEDNETQLAGGGNGYGPAYFSAPGIQADFPAYVVAPQCPKRHFWVKFGNNTPARYLRLVMELVAELKNTYPIDPLRVYVAGQSMGGFATWILLTEFPEHFAAGVPISGGGSPRKARHKLKAPVWAFHGGNDPLVRPWRSRLMVKALEKAERNVTYTEYPDGKHNIWPRVFADTSLVDWMRMHQLSTVPQAPRKNGKNFLFF